MTFNLLIRNGHVCRIDELEHSDRFPHVVRIHIDCGDRVYTTVCMLAPPHRSIIQDQQVLIVCNNPRLSFLEYYFDAWIIFAHPVSRMDEQTQAPFSFIAPHKETPLGSVYALTGQASDVPDCFKDPRAWLESIRRLRVQDSTLCYDQSQLVDKMGFTARAPYIHQGVVGQRGG